MHAKTALVYMYVCLLVNTKCDHVIQQADLVLFDNIILDLSWTVLVHPVCVCGQEHTIEREGEYPTPPLYCMLQCNSCCSGAWPYTVESGYQAHFVI